MMGGMGMGMGGGEDEQNFQTSEADTIMVLPSTSPSTPTRPTSFQSQGRGLQPELQARRRQPGREHQGSLNFKAPGARRPSRDDAGDVTAYAMRSRPGGASKRPDKVSFQVARWTPRTA